MLGPKEYGFGTAAFRDRLRHGAQCHLDTCPTGIATQREDLRAKFTGTPEEVVAFFTALRRTCPSSLHSAFVRWARRSDVWTSGRDGGRRHRLGRLVSAPPGLRTQRRRRRIGRSWAAGGRDSFEADPLDRIVNRVAEGSTGSR